MLLTGHNGAGKSSVFVRPSRPTLSLSSLFHLANKERATCLSPSRSTIFPSVTKQLAAALLVLQRCLAGLWKLPEGQIHKPGGSGGGSTVTSLAGTVFYLPQKPYNVLGTLVDQLTYPELGTADISAETVKEILDQVDLGYLTERAEVMTKETNWEEECSLVRSCTSLSLSFSLSLRFACSIVAALMR